MAPRPLPDASLDDENLEDGDQEEGKGRFEDDLLELEEEDTGEDGDDELAEMTHLYEPQPEPPVSDAARDRTLLMIAAFIVVGSLIVLLGANLLASTGLVGQGCDLAHSTRTAQCYDPSRPIYKTIDAYPNQVWPGSQLTLTIPGTPSS